jgi:hypothetical protein
VTVAVGVGEAEGEGVVEVDGEGVTDWSTVDVTVGVVLSPGAGMSRFHRYVANR